MKDGLALSNPLTQIIFPSGVKAIRAKPASILIDREGFPLDTDHNVME
jgi:hypothetical protein